MKKIMVFFFVFLLAFSFTACNSENTDSGNGKKEIYYLNFKPEIADVYNEIAKAYQEETGVVLNVVTAASGTYEQKLKSEIAKADAPVLFQINGPKGLSLIHISFVKSASSAIPIV